MFRRLTLPLILVGCLGVPYLATQGDLKSRWQGAVSSLSGGGESSLGQAPVPPVEPAPQAGTGQPPPGTLPGSPPLTQVSHPPALAGPQVMELGELLRFDVTPNWVQSHWSRVSTAPAGIELQGLRVPVVTGTNPHDLAGSLTYYFDREQVVQRIDFRGTTGDPSRLAAFVAQYYELKPEESLDAVLMMKKWNGKPISVLRVRRDTVVRADDTRGSYEVLLELNRPERGVRLSEPVMQQLEADRRGQRWE